MRVVNQTNRKQLLDGKWYDPTRDPLDHDGDGKKGGAVNIDDDTVKLRAEYLELTGKSADGRWKADRIRAEIDKALAE